MPTEQFVHVAAPAAAKRPATQALHEKEELPPVPSLAFPAGQSMHDVWPVPLWYFPGLQRAHDAEPGDAAKEPGKHSTQAPMEVAHEAPPYEPAAHWVQVEVQMEPAQEPAKQQEHSVAPAPL